MFIASPGDLAEERKLFPEILKQLNQIKAHEMGVELEPLGWEDTLQGMGRPQSKINEDVKKCDLFVMLPRRHLVITMSAINKMCRFQMH